MKRQALVQSILESAGSKIQAEISGLLDRQIALSSPTFQVLGKEDFFDQQLKKQVMAHLAVEGEANGESYVFLQVRDAILLGGTLIMLPPSELEERVAKEEFGEEEADAFGEIANILAGVLTTTFDDLFPDKLRIVKKELEVVAPTKVKTEAEEPFPDQQLLLATFNMSIDGQQLSPLLLVFPTALLGLASATAPSEAAAPPSEAAPPPRKAETENQVADAPATTDAAGPRESQAAGLAKAFSAAGETPPQSSPGSNQGADVPPVVLVIGDDEESTAIAGILEERGFGIRRLVFKDDVRRHLPEGPVRGAFLVMREVSEQGFATAIKVQSACGSALPLIAAGPQWTRRMVLQAVKYGVCDILVTPASPQEIGEKIDRHLRPTGT